METRLREPPRLSLRSHNILLQHNIVLEMRNKALLMLNEDKLPDVNIATMFEEIIFER